MQIDSLAPGERVAFGKSKEELVISCLNTHYSSHGYNLVPSNFFEDCKEKTDCWQMTKSGKRFRSAIKARVSKNDILICMRDPYYGEEDERTVVGRDVLNEYFQYITLSKDGETIRVANGRVIHKMCGVLWEEFLERVGNFDPTKPPYNKNRPQLLMCSDVYPGCQIWLHFDRWKGQPKILGFIPPDLLKEGKEIKFHKFIQETS